MRTLAVLVCPPAAGRVDGGAAGQQGRLFAAAADIGDADFVERVATAAACAR